MKAHEDKTHGKIECGKDAKEILGKHIDSICIDMRSKEGRAAFNATMNKVVLLKREGHEDKTHGKTACGKLLICPNCGYKCFAFEDRKCRYCKIKMKVAAK